MSYFQKSSRPLANLDINSRGSDSPANKVATAQFRKNADSRQSYLKAFKKYYIEKLISQKSTPEYKNTINNKQNQNSVQINSKKSIQKQEQKDCSRLNRSKIVALVNNNDNQIQQVLYNSLSQLERQMQIVSQGNDLARENKILKNSIQKLKVVLKQKLEVALKKNKQELTLMFDEYSSMIRKLLEDKQKLTNQLQNMKQCQEQEKMNVQAEYQNKIRIIVEDNNAQITSTKNQIQEFLDIIVQYQEQAAQQKQQMEKLRQKVVELQMENDYLLQERQNTLNHTQRAKTDTERYVCKIQNLINIIDKLQQQNGQLNQFLKTCRCSRIKSKASSSDSLTDTTIEDLAQKYQKQLVESQKQFIRQQMMFREALKRKDQCIERLQLVIEEMRKQRYQSVDRITEEALARQPR